MCIADIFRSYVHFRGGPMERIAGISDEEKYAAVVSCDRGYDGLFFYGVRTTGIFCRPSCSSRTPSCANVVFFDNAESAVKSGFRPCKKCRPDREAYDPDLDLVRKARDIFDRDFCLPIDMSSVSRQLGVSIGHLVRLFRQYEGMTPARYITKLRIQKAAEMLKNGDTGIMDAALGAGFKSLSYFYKLFKAETGHTPKKYKGSRGVY
jgi:AraC family transcriptional regulator of adaptative response / methylphosphotriester-DNA alkyltransferase methyltransferase